MKWKDAKWIVIGLAIAVLIKFLLIPVLGGGE